MNLLADEGIERLVVEELRSAGFRVTWVASEAPGSSDDSVLDLANRLEAILLTADKDFGELVHRTRRVTAGVVLVRLAALPPSERAVRVREALVAHAAEFAGRFAVVTPGALRIRSTPP